MTFRNDASRNRITPDEPRRLRMVALRQGQVLLDADLNANSGHLLDRTEIETADTLAPPNKLAVPVNSSAFRIQPGASGGPDDAVIGIGHAYLGGWLLESAGAPITAQPHPPAPTATSASPPFAYMLKAVLRHIDPAEEEILADRALGDAQAPGRLLNDWQVFPVPMAGYQAESCGWAVLQDRISAITAPSTGRMILQSASGAGSTDPCSLTPAGGYRRLENLLYRLEVHDGSPVTNQPVADGPRFGLNGLKLKLSRRNASVMARIIEVLPGGISFTVAPAQLDPVNWFAPGMLAEIVSIHDDVTPRPAGSPERLFRVADAQDERVELVATAAQIAATGLAANGDWALRLWEPMPDGAALAEVTLTAGQIHSNPVDIGDGLAIRLGRADARFRRGDYWCFAARADGTTDWPPGAERAADGPELRYTMLAAPLSAGPQGAARLGDCRSFFTRASDLVLHYRGGDGQNAHVPARLNPAAPWIALPAPLRVAVQLGQNPVARALVEWAAVPGYPSGRINGVAVTAGNPVRLTTDDLGLCEATWELDASMPRHLPRIEARLLGDGMPALAGIQFTAGLLSAEVISYRPGACDHLMKAEDVQTALDVLCERIGTGAEYAPEHIRLTDIHMYGDSGDVPLVEKDFILNGLQILPLDFSKGIRFSFNRPIGLIQPPLIDPLVEVTLDLPYPADDKTRLYWARITHENDAPRPIRARFGTFQMRLDGKFQHSMPDDDSQDGWIHWQPTAETMIFLSSHLQHFFGLLHSREDAGQLKEFVWEDKLPATILCRIRLRAALISSKHSDSGMPIWLNARHPGFPGPRTGRELWLAEVDPGRMGDLDMYVHISTKEHRR